MYPHDNKLFNVNISGLEKTQQQKFSDIDETKDI